MLNISRMLRRFRLWRSSPARRYRTKRHLTSGIGLVKLVVFLGFIAGLFFLSDRHIPHQHLIWRGLNPDAPTGFATKTQLLRVSLSPNTTCKKLALNANSLESVPADPKSVNNSPCGWKTARVHYGTDKITLSPGEATMQCPLSLGNYIWANEIDRLAQKHFGQSLTKIFHAGTYSCRRQRGNGSGAWSEHAFANAFDITGFELSEGRVISVLKHWNGTREEKRFLRDVRDQACKIFRVTLSPDFNAAHADHFHVDMGPSNSCS